MISAVLLIVAILLFLAAAFGVTARVQLGWLGAAFWATSFFLSSGGI